MKNYTYLAYNDYNGHTWDTKEFEIMAENKQDAYEKAMDLVCDHDFQEKEYPYLCVLKSSFRVKK